MSACRQNTVYRIFVLFCFVFKLKNKTLLSPKSGRRRILHLKNFRKFRSFFFFRTNVVGRSHWSYPRKVPPVYLGRFPFNQNVPFEFSASFSSEWNSIFQNFQKRGQPREVYPHFFFPFNFAPGISRIFG